MHNVYNNREFLPTKLTALGDITIVPPPTAVCGIAPWPVPSAARIPTLVDRRVQFLSGIERVTMGIIAYPILAERV